jgi:hypothetical protein
LSPPRRQPYTIDLHVSTVSSDSRLLGHGNAAADAFGLCGDIAAFRSRATAIRRASTR